MDGVLLSFVIVLIVMAILTCESRALLGKRCLPKSPIERVAMEGSKKRGSFLGR